MAPPQKPTAKWGSGNKIDMSETLKTKPALLVLSAGMGSGYGGLKQIDPMGKSGELKKVTKDTRIVDTNNGPVDLSVSEHPVALNYSDLVSMNLWGFTPSIFSYLEQAIRKFIRTRGKDPRAELYIPFVVDELICSNRATTIVAMSWSEWFGVTYPGDKATVQNEIYKLIQQAVYPDPLINNV